MTISYGTTGEEAVAARRAQEIRDLRRAGFAELDLDALRPAGSLFADSKGRLWRRAIGERWNGRSRELDAFAPTRDGRWAWFSRPDRGPTTVAELEEREAAKAKQQAAAQHQRAKELEQARARAEVVTLGDLAEARDAPATLREAALRLHAMGGILEIVDGQVVVRLPKSAFGVTPFSSGRRPGVEVARFLYACERSVLEAVKGKDGTVDVDRLPDRPVLGSGRLA